MKAQAAVEAENIALIKHFSEELDKGNFEVFKEVYAPDAAYYFPSGVTLWGFAVPRFKRPT